MKLSRRRNIENKLTKSKRRQYVKANIKKGIDVNDSSNSLKMTIHNSDGVISLTHPKTRRLS